MRGNLAEIPHLQNFKNSPNITLWNSKSDLRPPAELLQEKNAIGKNPSLSNLSIYW